MCLGFGVDLTSWAEIVVDSLQDGSDGSRGDGSASVVARHR